MNSEIMKQRQMRLPGTRARKLERRETFTVNLSEADIALVGELVKLSPLPTTRAAVAAHACHLGLAALRSSLVPSKVSGGADGVLK